MGSILRLWKETMNLLKLMENHFWLFLLFGMVLGFLIPEWISPLYDYLIVMLMAILFITFVKINPPDLISHARRPLFLGYILSVNLILIPVICYLLTLHMDLDLRISLVLLSTLPSGTAAPALTEIIGGDTALSLMMTVLSTLLAPITIPLIFYLLFSTKIELSYMNMFLSLLCFIILPMLAAQATRKFLPSVIEKGSKYLGPITVMLIMLLAMTAIGKQADYIRAHIADMVIILITLFALFILFQAAGFFTAFGLPANERIALSISKMAMNNVLGIVIAMNFFNPRVTLILILSVLPWNTLPGLYKLYLHYLPAEPGIKPKGD